LVLLDADDVAILTRNDRVGEVIIHFPRIGFDMRAKRT
jgi:hypothetical protein